MDIPDTDTSSERYLILHVLVLSLLEVMSDMIRGRGVVGRG
jgi:hypothetical protein